MRRQSKLPQTITINLELGFMKMSSQWKGIKEEKSHINPNFLNQVLHLLRKQKENCSSKYRTMIEIAT
jgi:hypothetical protein